jgi:hypothetical protein
MNRMARLRVTRYRAAIVALSFALGLAQGCSSSRPMSPGDASASASTPQNLPFHRDVQQASTSRGTDPAVSPDPKLAAGLPFRSRLRPQILPAGTLLTVQLEHSLSAASVHAGDPFAAALAAALVIDGDTVIRRGAEVTGRIEAAQSLHGSGYVQLTLSAIRVDGALLPLQTSSLFARGSVRKLNASSDPPNQVLGGTRIPNGRRLTFRLTGPVSLGELSSSEKPQAPKLSSE